MKTTTLHLHTRMRVGEVDPRIFGGFLEHMGRAVYEGIYDPRSAHADPHGCRTDVLEALRRLDFSVVRYPGGNFVSGYHWEDGVGPRSGRPTVRELAWNTTEPNEFGTDEFLSLAARMGWQPMMTVNLGTGTPEEARNWLEYCNGAAGTKYADLRVVSGRAEPWGVPLWCLGNEMDGPWQLGHLPAEQYAIRAQQTAKLMKDLDPSIEVVVCGSSSPDMPTWLDWDRAVLEHLGGLADYVSLHRYVGNRTETAEYLALSKSIDRQIEDLDAVCRAASGRRHARRRAYLCFDEWNVWYKTMNPEGMNPQVGWPRPLIEEIYNLEDALVVAEFLNSFIRHADCVKIANLAQVVNVIAPVLTRGDDLLVQSIFYAFEMFSRRRSGSSLRVGLEGPTYDAAVHGETPFIDASTIVDGTRLHVFAVNRSPDEAAPLVVAVADREVEVLETAEILTGSNPKTANTWDDPAAIRSQPWTEITVDGGRAQAELPPLSLLAATLRLR